MIRRSLFVLLVFSLAAWADETPKPTSLTEKVESRLVQLDVTVEGDPAAIRGITAKDIGLYVGEHEVRGVIVDRLCGDAAEPEAPRSQETQTALPARPTSTFIFFFDQLHLTVAGRALAIETTRALIDRLIVNGNRASIVSNAMRLQGIVPMTSDREKLQAGLESLRKDVRGFDPFAQTEQSRVDTVGRIASDSGGRGDIYCPLGVRALAEEEWQIAHKSMERMGFALGTLAEASAPKAMIYFGDTLRQKAGLHFYRAAGDACSTEAMTGEMIPSAGREFDALVTEALARGIHFYTIEAEGLIPYRPGLDDDRRHQAQNTLVGLAAETGGEAFLGGASNKHIADRIAALTSCRLLLSFPPADLPRDQAMNVTLALHVPGVKVGTQGRIVVPSQSSIEHARLLAAFVDPASSDDGSLRVALIPRGSDGKTWSSSVQLRLRPTGVPDNSAELGASVVRRDTVTDHFAASIATKSASRAMVLEKSMDIAPGAFSIVAVARDASRNDVGSSRLEAEWPDPGRGAASIAPIAVLQTAHAAISKDGAVASTGSLAYDADETLDPAASISLASVVCRGARNEKTVVVERWLEDGARNEFEPVTLEGGGRCAPILDVVKPGRIAAGAAVDYRIVARIGNEIVANERRTLRLR